MNASDTIAKRPPASRISRFESNRSPVASSPDSDILRAASLLLGIELRGWLSNREKEYLDTLAPKNALTFLVLGREYLHPQDLDLFPIDLIDAAIAQGGDAVFSQRCEHKSDNATPVSRVFTGLIGDCAGKPLVLGMFGPDNREKKHAFAERFEQTVSAFRSARRSVTMLVESLQPLPDGAARLLVNRASGRIIHVDDALCAAANREAFHFVSREYGTVEPILGRLVRKYKMKMENLACGCLYVSCMTFTPADAGGAGNIRLHTSLLEDLRGDIAGITSSAEYLHTHGDALAVDDIRSLATQIARTGERLGRRLARHHFLATYDRLDTENVNVLYQLQQAIDRLAPNGDSDIALSGEAVVHLTTVAPRDAYRLLFESILDTHRATPGTAGATAVRVSDRGNDRSVSIAFSTEVSGTLRVADLERVWFAETEKLARRLGVTLHRKLQLESNTIVTRVTIPAQENQA